MDHACSRVVPKYLIRIRVCRVEAGSVLCLLVASLLFLISLWHIVLLGEASAFHVLGLYQCLAECVRLT